MHGVGGRLINIVFYRKWLGGYKILIPGEKITHFNKNFTKI